jgi:hypothetical protein
MSLVETLAVLSLEGLLLATLTSALIASTDVSRTGKETTRRIVARRHFEHLLDRTFAAAGGGAAAPVPLLRAEAAELIVQADLNDDGRIDVRSAERSALELRSAPASTLRLLHRIGRQAITIDERIPAPSRLRYYAADGRTAAHIDEIRVVAVATSSRTLYFAVPPPP